MTRVHNDPALFAEQMLDGFARVHRRWVAAVPGGVVSRRRRPGTVSVVIGGGSGHYPAFGGLVGPGMAAAAAMGNVFASPSAQQVHAVATSAEAGGGVLLAYGNYAGDVLNFDQAQARLRAEGIACETVVVTDDVASAPVGSRELRRGIAGDLAVFKIAGASAERGDALAEVARIARRANDRTATLGVAFGGCTLPGADAPLFHVPEGRMALGLGIHGEPGIAEMDIPSADDLAEILVSRLLHEAPDDGARVVVIVNGLGSVTQEELFVLYGAVERLLGDRGLEVADAQVGEFCTSFDMAGLSLTLVWVDDELETLWLAPSDTPAYRSGAVADEETYVELRADPVAAPDARPAAVPEGSPASRRLAARIAAGAADIAALLAGLAPELGRLDAVAGDGDHGIGMQRGSRAAAAAASTVAEAGGGASSTLRAAADGWADRAGGTSGALWGLLLTAVAEALDDDATPRDRDVAAGVTAGVLRIREFGKAELGDKTMIDAALPFAEVLAAEVDAGTPLAEAWSRAARAARAAAESTADIVARRGRARTHGDSSVGTPDPGAVSLAAIAEAVGELLVSTEGNTL